MLTVPVVSTSLTGMGRKPPLRDVAERAVAAAARRRTGEGHAKDQRT
jgi:hypothetical protein